MTANAELFGVLIEHLLLTALPGVAATLWAVRRGARGVPVLLCIALASSGLVAILSFWAYYASPTVGQAWGYLVLFGSIELLFWLWRRGGLDRSLLRELRVPLLLWVFGSFFVTYLGFVHGGTDRAIEMASIRFSGQLPSDNDIPRFFAEWFSVHGHEGNPPIFPGEWLSSDRPPLQVGYILSQRDFSNDVVNLHYQVLCVVIQQLWIVAMWAVLTAARVRPLTRSLAIVTALVSDVAIVNGFFVWPKLLAATFVLAALALVVSPQWITQRRDPRVAALFATLCALAMLAHGASVFGLIPLVAIAVRRGLPSWRWLAVGGAVGIVLMASWSAYQKYGDPPGNRLNKWMLASVTEIDDRGTLEAMADSYGEAGLGGAVRNRAKNFGEMAGWPGAKNEIVNAFDFAKAGDGVEALEAIRRVRFFSMLPFLGIFLVAPICMLFARRRVDRADPDWRFALVSLVFFVVGCVAWGLILFGDQAPAVIHTSSLALPLIGLCGCVAGLCVVAPRAACYLVGASVLFVLGLYVPSLQPLAGSAYSPLAALLAATALFAFAAVALRAQSGDSSSATRHGPFSGPRQ